MSSVFVELVGEVGLSGRDELGELRRVFGADILESEDGSLLFVDHCSETGLVLDDNVRDTHLAAESWDEND